MWGLEVIHLTVGIVNEAYDKALIHQYTWPGVTKYMKKKFNWSNTTVHSIVWKAFHHEAQKLDIN